MVVASENSLSDVVSCELQASHDTTEYGLAWAWLSDHPQGSVCSSFLLHQLSLVHLRCKST